MSVQLIFIRVEMKLCIKVFELRDPGLGHGGVTDVQRDTEGCGE